jgi:hypothetical protein
VKSEVDKRMKRPLERGRPITGGVNWAGHIQLLQG